MKWTAKWIKPMIDYGDVVPVFTKQFQIRGKVTKAVLYMTAMGVYEASINGKRVSDYVLAPGWTTYYKRLQYQEYDVTEFLKEENRLTVLVGKGWYRSNMSGKMLAELKARPCGVIGELHIEYEDGQNQIIYTIPKELYRSLHSLMLKKEKRTCKPLITTRGTRTDDYIL